MKKIDKLELIKNSIGSYNLCRFYFKYSAFYLYLYMLDASDKLLLGIEEDDFLLDGFQIRKLSDIKKVEFKDDLCIEILKEHQALKNVLKPDVDITSWKTVIESLQAFHKLIIIENETKGEDGFFYLGYIKEVKKSYLIFSNVDAAGQWYEDKIYYSEITSITFDDRYSKSWQEYLKKYKNLQI